MLPAGTLTGTTTWVFVNVQIWGWFNLFPVTTNQQTNSVYWASILCFLASAYLQLALTQNSRDIWSVVSLKHTCLHTLASCLCVFSQFWFLPLMVWFTLYFQDLWSPKEICTAWLFTSILVGQNFLCQVTGGSQNIMSPPSPSYCLFLAGRSWFWKKEHEAICFRALLFFCKNNTYILELLSALKGNNKCLVPVWKHRYCSIMSNNYSKITSYFYYHSPHCSHNIPVK